MYVDSITLAAVADELRFLLLGARIDTIIQPTEHALAIQCYAPGSQEQSGHNRWLYLSAHPQLARLHLTALKPPKIASEPPAFVMLLRKHLEGARIEAFEQPRWERVLEIVASYRPADAESDERVRYRLIIEIMGRNSNIILCDAQGLILGSIKHVGANVNRYRVIIPNVPYVPPPPQQRTFAGQQLPRLEPTTVTAAQLAIIPRDETETLAAVPEGADAQAQKRAAPSPKLWQLLVKHLLGFSPLPAREAVYRATGQTETVVDERQELWEELAWNVRELALLYDTRRWQSRLVERAAKDAEPAQPLAFAPYVLEQYAETPDLTVRESPSINVLIDDYYARTEWHDAMNALRTPMRKVLQSQRDRCKRKADLLQRELAGLTNAAQYRLQAELLLTFQHDIPQGQASVVLSNIFESQDEGEPPAISVPLDPRFDAVQNANRLFNKYHKLRRAAALIPGQIEQNAAELATIEQLLADLVLAETPAELTLVKAEVQAAGYLRGAAATEKKKVKKGGKQGKGKKATLPGGGVPLHVQSRDGFTILIGKNSRQNEEVTFRQATTNDIWLHARGMPGAHVIIKCAGREVPRGTIEQAASVAAYYSQARGSTGVTVDYTFQRHVRHMKGGGPGMVIYDHERTIYAEPQMIP
ncbi:MAG: NFACT family protein [Chloroflexota bacterium]|nr:NFACT family protein [Chloroflexota bacterium]